MSGILDTTRALLTALRAEGALPASPAPGPAPWGANVHLRRTSDVVEVSGANAGASVSPTWPMLLLYGPKVEEMKEHTTPGARIRQNYDAGARTIEVRPAPVMHRLRFRVVWQTRSGFGTGTGGSATTAEAQLLDGIARFGRWCRAHRAFEGAVLFSTATLGASTTPRITPADVMEAVGEIRIEWVQEFDAAATVVDAGPTLVTTPDPDDADV